MSRENLAVQDDADDDYMGEEAAIGLGCALEAFAEADVVRALIAELPTLSANDYQFERHRERFITVLDRYQEQPHLLDPFVPDLLAELIVLIRGTNERNRHAAAAFAAHIFKVRKPKVVVKQLPHEVIDVEPVLLLLELEDPHGIQNWETRYFLLLWMSMLVLIPFDLGRFDSGAVDAEGRTKKKLMERILNVIKVYLSVANKCQDAAAFLASKFLTRPEIQKIYLSTFLDFCMKSVANEEKTHTDILRMGAMKAVASLFKQAKRDDVLGHASNILGLILKQKFKENANVLLRKLSLKVVQRIGLTFLKAKVASWRYQRGSRSLALNLESGNKAVQATEEEKKEEEEDYDIPDEIEDVIEELLCGLRDKETVARWSAAKGIGRVTGRLPKELADDVVGSLLQLFSLRETDAAWHGGCLALAELGRRGLLLPERLPEVVQVVLKALVYDEKKGSFSVGSHIRDAACYVSWSFARAYEPVILRPYVRDIANALVTAAIFDREVNCRRAASAAFQENVGRQGTFPHGIDILTRADYFSVGSRMNTFLKISVFIAQFEEYRDCLIQHLLEKKIGHWDIVIREITATALHNLTPVAPEKMAKEVLPKLISNADGTDLFTRHGSIIAVGAVVNALSKVATQQGKSLRDYLDEEALSSIKQIAVKLVQKLSLRITGGDLLRQALTMFIDHCSQASFPCHQEDTVRLWQAILDENLSSPDPLIQEKATIAFPHFLEEYYRDPLSKELLVSKRDALIAEYLKELDSSELHRRGFSLALGAFPKFALVNRLPDIMNKLISCTKITKETEKWAEGRRDCILALIKLVKTVGVEKEQNNISLDQSALVRIFDCFLHSLDDYTLDRRGDIGAWVREAGMTGLVEVTTLVARSDPTLVPEFCVREMMPRLAQQAVEKIDRTRGLAAKLFTLLLMAKDVPGIPDRQEVLKAFPDKLDMETFQWSVESETFPIFTKLLNLDCYRERIILGLVVSVGGLTERLVKHASASLFSELKTMDSDELNKFVRGILNVFTANQKNDRVTVSLFKFLDQLLTSGFLDQIMEDEENPFATDLLIVVKAEISRCGEPNKLMLSCDVICALLQCANREAVKKSLVQLSIFLCHKFPRIRKVTAGKMFEALLTYSDREIVPEANLDEVNTILSDTNWDSSIEELRPIRNALCDLLNIPAPAIIKRSTAQ